MASASAVRTKRPRRDDESSRARYSARRSVGESLRGLKRGARGQSGFAVQFFLAALVFAGALTLGASVAEWALLVFACGAAVAAECFHAAIETLARGAFEAEDERLRDVVGMSSAGTLAVFLGAAGASLFVLVPRAVAMLLGPLVFALVG